MLQQLSQSSNFSGADGMSGATAKVSFKSIFLHSAALQVQNSRFVLIQLASNVGTDRFCLGWSFSKWVTLFFCVFQASRCHFLETRSAVLCVLCQHGNTGLSALKSARRKTKCWWASGETAAPLTPPVEMTQLHRHPILPSEAK